MDLKVLFFFPLFILGIVAGFFYFSHMWRSINIYGTEKNKILKSMIIRLPIPIIAVLIGSFAGVGGIISVLLGFTTFQIYFLVKTGKKLKEEIEKEAEEYDKESKEDTKEN
ncbi:ATP synthase subunit I [Persephonella sp.]